MKKKENKKALEYNVEEIEITKRQFLESISKGILESILVICEFGIEKTKKCKQQKVKDLFFKSVEKGVEKAVSKILKERENFSEEDFYNAIESGTEKAIKFLDDKHND